MRRISRILLNASTAVSLALCLATVALCVRSYWVADSVIDLATGTVAMSSRGTLDLGGCHDRSKVPPRPRDSQPSSGLAYFRTAPQNLEPRRPLPGEPGVRRSSFAVGSVSWFITDGGTAATPMFTGGSGPTTFYPAWEATAPHWAVAVLLGLLPAIRLLRRRRPTLPGLCPTCNYDLRATPDRCPECGTIPAR